MRSERTGIYRIEAHVQGTAGWREWQMVKKLWSATRREALEWAERFREETPWALRMRVREER